MRKFFFSFLFAVLFSLCFTSSIHAAAKTYYVAGDVGNDSYTSAQATVSATPWKTIQKAADSVTAGDTVNVKGGITYSTTSACFMFTAVVCLSKAGTVGNYITFQPWTGTGNPIIDGGNTAKGFSYNYVTRVSYNKITGFIIKDTADGIYISGLGVIVANNIIYDTVLTNYHWGIVSGLSDEADTIDIYNNTIYQKFFGIHIDKGSGIIKNNIIVNGTYGIESNAGMYVGLTIDYNDVYNNTSNFDYLGLLQRPGHDFSLDPQFTDPSIFNFTLKNTSPVIDAGIAISDVTSDIVATARPQGNAYDMGAYESAFSQATPPNSVAAILYTAPFNIMAQLATYTGEAINTQFGMLNTYSSTLIGDVNEDGLADVLVGGRHTVPNGGFYAFFGRATPVNTEALNADVIIRGVIASSRISDNVSLGDIDGDGKNELLLTDYNAGKAYIFNTGSSFVSQTVASADATITGPAHFGTGSTILGDVNGDGYDDYIVYSDTANSAYLFYGDPILSDKSYTEADVTYTVNSSISFTRAGDINRDGYKDIVMGCSGCNSGYGSVFIFYGGTNLSNKSLSEADVILNSTTSAYGFGSWNALGDVNGDGYSDLLTVSLFKTYVFFGGPGFTNKTSDQADLVFTADPANPLLSNLAFAVETGDINNDGYLDIICSNSSLPRTYVFYGGPNITSKNGSQADLVFDYIETQRGFFGGPITTGDVNGDGYTEIAAGNGQYSQRLGKVWLFGPPHGTPQITIGNVGITSGSGLSGTITDSAAIGGVEASYDGGSWNNCSLTSGSFNCSFSGLSGGLHSVRIRSKTDLGVYIPTREYISRSFGILTSASGPACLDTISGNIPWLKSAVAQNSNSILLSFGNLGNGADKYALEYGTKSGKYQFGSDYIGGKDTNSYLVKSLSPDTTYYFRVRGGKGCATGAWSNEVSNKTLDIGLPTSDSTISEFQTPNEMVNSLIIEHVFPTAAATPKPQIQNIFQRFVNFFKVIFHIF